MDMVVNMGRRKPSPPHKWIELEDEEEELIKDMFETYMSEVIEEEKEEEEEIEEESDLEALIQEEKEHSFWYEAYDTGR